MRFKSYQLIFGFLTLINAVFAQTTFTGSGVWSDASKWSLGVPTNLKTATISNGSTCTIDVLASCASLTIAASNANTSIAISGSNTLTVSGKVTIGTPNSNNITALFDVANGTLTCTSISLANPANGTNRFCILQQNNGTINVTTATGISMAGSTTENFINCIGNGIINNAGVLGNGGSITPGNGTINFNGTGAQTIRNYNYYNLISSSTGARTLLNSGTIGIAGTFTPGNNTYTITGSTINFNGTGIQSVPRFQYNNLTISGARTTNDVTFISGDTIFVSGNGSNTATFTTGAIKSSGNVFIYNGGRQTLGGFVYNHLILSGSGSIRLKSSGGAISVNGDFTVAVGDSINLTGQNATVNGQTIINGTLTDNNTGGTNTMIGHVIVNGYWNITSAESFTLSGGITNNGYFSSSTGTYFFSTNNQSIDGSQPIIMNGNITINNGITLTNKNTITVVGSITGSVGCIFLNDIGATLNIGGAMLATGTLDASANGNTIIYNNPATQSLKSGIYYHLTKQNTGILNVTSAAIINGNFSINSGTLTVSGASGTITGNASGNFNMASGSVLNLGLTSQTNAISFPSNFTNAHIALNTNSTVNYNSNTASQSISLIPNYGNLGIATGSTTITKTLSTNLNMLGNLTLTNGTGVITLSASANNISVNGDLLGNGKLTFTTGNFNLAGNSNLYTGILTIGTGTVTINGSVNQNISGANFYNFTLTNLNGATITSAASVSNTLTVSNGTLATSGLLTLLSNATRTARIAPLTSGSILGDVIVQRFIPGGVNRRAWRFLASPVGNVSFLNSWQDSIHITGIGTGGTACPSLTKHTNGFDATANNSPSIYTFNEVSNTWNSIANTNATNLIPGNGYRIFVRGSRNDGCNLLSSVVNNTSNVTLQAKGTIVIGSKTLSLTRTNSNGWNLVGNPYASAIDWGNSGWQAAMGASINKTIYIWNPVLNVYATWHPIAGALNGGSNIIASGQAFFVSVTSAANLTFQESYKSTDETTMILGKTSPNNQLKIQLLDTAVLDETIIYSYPTATANFDNDLDGVKFDFGTNRLASFTTIDSTKLSYNGFLINASPMAIDTVTLSVGFSSTPKTYSFNFIGINSFTKNIWLYDKFTSNRINLSTTNTITFTTTTNALSLNQNRFYLLIADKNNSALPVSWNEFAAQKINNKVELNWQTASEKNTSHFVIERSIDAQNFSEIGLVKSAENSTQLSNYIFEDVNPQLASTNYYRLKQMDIDGRFTYSNIVSVLFDVINSSVQVFPNPTSNELNIDLGEIQQNITVKVLDNFGALAFTKMYKNSQHIKLDEDFSALSAGIYFIEVSNNENISHTEKLIKY